jgi:hypothetical protein
MCALKGIWGIVLSFVKVLKEVSFPEWVHKNVLRTEWKQHDLKEWWGIILL